MKCLWLLLFLFSDFKVECKSSNSLVSRAILSIIENVFVQETGKIDLINYGSKLVIEEVLLNNPHMISVQTLKDGADDSRKNQLNISSILFFDSPENFKERVNNIRWLSNPRRRFKHLVYVPNLTTSDIDENINDAFNIDSVGFLMNDNNKSIDLIASYMFTAQKCLSNQLFTINTFHGQILK